MVHEAWGASKLPVQVSAEIWKFGSPLVRSLSHKYWIVEPFGEMAAVSTCKPAIVPGVSGTRKGVRGLVNVHAGLT
jgi:hypothetical protein